MNLTQLIQENIRGNSLLDLIITNKPEKCKDTRVIEPHISDHQATLTNFAHKRLENAKYEINFRTYKLINWKSFHSDCQNITYKKTEYINIDTKSFIDNINQLFDKSAPRRSKNAPIKSKVMHVSSYTKELMNKRNYRGTHVESDNRHVIGYRLFFQEKINPLTFNIKFP